MATLVAFDPGLRGTGVAVFKDGMLTRCAYVKSPNLRGRGAKAWRDMGLAVATWVFEGSPWSSNPAEVAHEQMQVYRAGLQKGNPNDLLELSGVCGWAAALLEPESVVSYLPRKWKGQVPKDVHHRRIKAEMSEVEHDALHAAKCPASLQHNILDAIGIGLFHLGRVRGG